MTFPRFTLRTLLGIVFLVALYLVTMVTSFRLGTQAGYQSGYENALSSLADGAQSIIIRYPVVDIIHGRVRPLKVTADKAFFQKALTQLADDITTSVRPLVWDRVGGRAGIVAKRDREGNVELVIDCDISTHLEVSRFLDELRGAPFGIRPPTNGR